MFYIYDSQGFKTPFDAEEASEDTRQAGTWREIKEVSTAFGGKSKDHKQEQGKENLLKKKKGKIIPIVAEQIMSYPVTTLSAGSLLKEARELFDSKKFRHIPIISTDGKIIGLLSDRMMLHETTEFIKFHKEEEEDNRSVGEIMATNILCADPNTDVSQIAKIFMQEQVPALPIVDSQGNIKGMLTRSDILRTILKISPPTFNT